MKNIIRYLMPIVAITGLVLYSKHKQSSPAKQEKVLAMARDVQVKSLDPIHIRDGCAVWEAAKVYEGLLAYHYLKRPLELVPNLAAALPTVSEDQLVYTFQLQKGIKFHDNPCFPQGKGRELTAHDFVYSFKRLADPRNQAAGFSLVDGKIKGLNEWRQKYADEATTDYTEVIEGIQALDAYTLQFTLTKPYPQFLYTLVMLPCYAVAREAVEYYGAEFPNHPVGTGPFMLEAFNPQNNTIVYHKNPTFRDKRFPKEAADEYKHMLAYAGKPLPLVDKVISYILPEEQPRWLKFQKGQLDAIDLTESNITSEVVHGKELLPVFKEKEIQLFQEPEFNTYYIVINHGCPLLKSNLKLRQALSMAFDAEKYNELFYQGRAVLAQSTLPPGLAGYRADYINPYRIYNVAKAKKYLAEAGYPGGKGLPEITLDVFSSTNARQQGEFFQKCMSAIGVKIKIVENIWPELLKKIQNKATMLHAISWGAEYPDAENFFQLLYGPNQALMGTSFDDPAYNALYEKATSMSDSPEKTALYERLNQMAAENVPMIYTVHRSCVSLYHGWVKNYMLPNCISGIEQYIDIDLDQKRALMHKL